MARPRSNWILTHFQPAGSGNCSEVQCLRCKQSFKYSSRNGPTNLLRHLDKSHRIDPHVASNGDVASNKNVASNGNGSKPNGHVVDPHAIFNGNGSKPDGNAVDPQLNIMNQLYKENLAVPHYTFQPKSPIGLQSPLPSSPQMMTAANKADNNQSLSLRLERVERSMTRLEQRLMISLNSQRGNGLEIPFEVVPFNSGLLPQEMERMQLPMLLNCNVLFQCSSQALDIYMNGYGHSCQGLSKREKVVQVGISIGCYNVERFLKACC